jgi:succinate dehydrogenase / fumarate reductase iron-sulfur subunit
MKFSIDRDVPDANDKPYMQDYDVALAPTHHMLLDAININGSS